MKLTARSPNCFSSHYVLKLNGIACGHFSGRWFSESIEVQATSRMRLQFQKAAWLSRRFQLVEPSTDAVLARGNRSGFFTTAWDLTLTTGPARLVSAGLMNSGFTVQQLEETVAHVNRIGLCEGGWFVDAADHLARTDLIFIGLVYHTILQRRRSSD